MTFADHLPVLIIVMPLLSALIIPIAGRKDNRVSRLITVIITNLCFLIALYLLNKVMIHGRISYRLGGWEPPWGIEYVLDYFNAFVLVIVSFIGAIVSWYAGKSVEKEIDESKITFFYAVYMLYITGLMGIVVTGDIFNLYVFLEISSIAGYALIAMGKKRDALVASYNYLILGTIAATFILLGIGYLYMATGTLNMADLREKLPPLYHSNVVRTAFAFFMVGLSIKFALFPLHIWLPNAHTSAPSVISAVLAAAALKVGVYAMLRVMFTVFKPEFDFEALPVSKIFIFLSVIAIIAGSLLAIAQTKIKRMLAYSSVGQMGYIVLGAVIANKTAMTGSLLHLLNHALMKASLFLIVGAIIYKTGLEKISDLKGLGKKMPFTMAAFTIGGLSMIGVPLTVGFVSKWYIAVGAVKSDMWFLVPVILISSLLTAAYFWRVIESVYFPAKETAHHPPLTPPLDKEGQGGVEPPPAGGGREEGGDAPAGMLIPILVLAGLCIFFGIAAFIPVSVAEKAAVMLLGSN